MSASPDSPVLVSHEPSPRPATSVTCQVDSHPCAAAVPFKFSSLLLFSCLERTLPFPVDDVLCFGGGGGGQSIVRRRSKSMRVPSRRSPAMTYLPHWRQFLRGCLRLFYSFTISIAICLARHAAEMSALGRNLHPRLVNQKELHGALTKVLCVGYNQRPQTTAKFSIIP
jgi:hypothetical protein